MAKFFGKIGFIVTEETDPDGDPGVWEEVAVERDYYGDFVRRAKRWDSSDKINDDLSLTSTISIVADPYFNDNLAAIKYVVWRGTKWKITNVEPEFPRFTLTVGGIYNG